VATITITEGANATPPGDTGISVSTASDGAVTHVIFGWMNGSTFTPLGDTDGVPIYGDTTLVDQTATTFNTPISISDAATSTELIAANPDRKGWRVQNMSTADLYVRIDGGTAALTSCHAVLRQYEAIGQKAMDGDLSLTAITGRWATDAGGTAIGGDWE
jgi:hypothetical protein